MNRIIIYGMLILLESCVNRFFLKRYCLENKRFPVFVLQFDTSLVTQKSYPPTCNRNFISFRLTIKIRYSVKFQTFYFYSGLLLEVLFKNEIQLHRMHCRMPDTKQTKRENRRVSREYSVVIGSRPFLVLCI